MRARGIIVLAKSNQLVKKMSRKNKFIPIMIHLSNVLRSGYITARDQSMVESGVTEGVKNTASFLLR